MLNYRFNLNYVERSGKSNSLECGSMAHSILEFFEKAIISGTTRSEAIEIGFKAGIEYKDGYSTENVYITDESEEGMRNTPEESDSKNIGWKYVISTMEEYFEYYKNDSFTILGAEEVRGSVIFEDDDLRVLWKAKYDCIIDNMTGIMSMDHKTMKQRRPTMKLNNQFKGQCVLLKSRNIMINKIGWQKSLPPREKFERAIISYSADVLAEFCNDLVPYYARMLAAYTESGVWPQNITHCENKYGQCTYVKVCENDRGMRDEVLELEYVKGKAWDI